MKRHYQNIEEAITEALRASNKIVHHTIKCSPHVRSFMEYMPIEVYSDRKSGMAVIVSINERSEKPTLPMTIQKKWDVYRQSSVKGIKLVLHGGEANNIHKYIAQIIDIMELEKDYSEIAKLLPFDCEVSRDQTCIVSELVTKYGLVRMS